VISGQTVELTATANVGYTFLRWDGTGLGATAGAQSTRSQVTIQPGGPVSEFAVFEPTPPTVYSVQVAPTGLPNGQQYSVTLGATSYSGTGSFTISNVSGGSYTLAFPNVTGVGVAISRYVVTGVTGPGVSSGAISIHANVTIIPTFETQYFVTVTAVGSGSVSVPTTGFWQTGGSLLTITATPQAGSVFENWLGAVDGGSSQLLGTSSVLQLTLAGSVDLVAQFGAAPVVVGATYSLALNESGLPAGTTWQLALTPGHGASGNGKMLLVNGLSGHYGLTVPTVYVGAGERFVPTLVGPSNLDITANMSTSVSFQEQFLVSVSVSAAGQPSTTNESWAASGSQFTLSAPASPVAGWAFEGWQGIGAGSYTGSHPSATITLSGPVTETATFAAQTTASSASVSPFDWAALAIIVVVLLTVGLAEGYLLGRRRRKPPTARPGLATTALSPLASPAIEAPPAAPIVPVEPVAPTPPEPKSPLWSEGPIPDDPAWLEK